MGHKQVYYTASQKDRKQVIFSIGERRIYHIYKNDD